jgi:16S rRNA (adenine1518-N6/adenine1519-N6)-dimethyltransferase
VLELGPDAFVPRPRVRSRFLVFDPAESLPDVRDLRVLRNVVRTAFQHRRKTLRAALRSRIPAAAAALEATGIDGSRRGETLTPEEFVSLSNHLASG